MVNLQVGQVKALHLIHHIEIPVVVLIDFHSTEHIKGFKDGRQTFSITATTH